MSTIRIPEKVWAMVRGHLFSTPGEHFAFMLARWTYSFGKPIFIVRDVVIVPDDQVQITREGYQLTIDGILNAVNTAVRSGEALIEVHNHGGARPRFSPTDRDELQGFSAYVLDSLSGRPYAATVWGDSTIYGEFFLPDGQTGSIGSITIAGCQFQQLVSHHDDHDAVAVSFDRQLPWFTTEGQRRLGRIRVGIAGAGGTGSQLIQNLAYLGIRDFVLIDDDVVDDTSLNRTVTATPADVNISKGLLGQQLIKSVAPDANVTVIQAKVQSAKALDVLKGLDIVFGCFDNDAARLILNELALAYSIPYFDLGVGIDAEDGKASSIGGRVAIVLPGGPCLYCMGEIDADEARFFLNTPEEQSVQLARGYVRGMEDVKAPSVVSLNATIAALATNEFAVFVSGLRPVNVYTELDVLGIGRPIKSQWMTPRRVQNDPGCVQCAIAGSGDATNIERYAVR